MIMWSRLFLVAALPALCLAINVPYEFRLRVDSINGIAVNDLTPQLQIEYYTVDDCLPLRGQESDPLSFNSSLVSVADWSSEPLRLLGILDTKSDLLCIKFAVVDVSPTTNSGKRETVAKYSINTRLFKNYFDSLDSEMQWVYADDRGANTSYVYYTTKVSYSVNVRDLIGETTVTQRGDVAAAVLLTTLGVSLVIELIDYFVLSDPVKRKERNGCTAAIIIMRGTLWMFFGGLWTAILYVLIGALLMVSLVGIPFGLKLMKISVMILLPFERDMIEDELSENRFRLSLTANIIWIAMGGAILSIMHLACAIILIMTILGIPFAMEQIKLARVALAPFGKTVVRLEGKRFGHFTDHVLKHTASEGDVNQAGHNVDDVEKELAGHGGKSNF